MSSFPPELADPVEQLRARLVEISSSEQACMTTVAAGASSHGKHLPEAQSIMIKCRQASAAAAATAIDTFRHECSDIGTQANSLAETAIVAATVKNVSEFWAKSESLASAFAAEAAAQLGAQGPDTTTQAINNVFNDRASSINRYFEQLSA